MTPDEIRKLRMGPEVLADGPDSRDWYNLLVEALAQLAELKIVLRRG